MMRRLLDEDRSIRAYHEGETDVLPAFYHDKIRRDLGSLYQFLPEGAIYHDQNAYLKAQEAGTATVPTAALGRRPARPAVVTQD